MEKRNPIVFLDLRIGEERVGRVIIELFEDEVPKTVENFLALCVGNHTSDKTGKKLHYKGTIFHKVIANMFIQGGDVTNFDGSSGESIFEGSFQDEDCKLLHDKPGVVSTVRSGDSNNSQFIITVADCSHLNGSCVVFGRVLKGLACVAEVSHVSTEDDCPTVKCMIEDCGQILPGEPWNYLDDDGTEDIYPFDPKDVEIENFEISDLGCVVNKIRESGNHLFLKHNIVEAERKYKKGLRYIEYWTAQPMYAHLNEKTKNEIAGELEKAKITCLLNSATVALKRGLFRQSLYLCDEVIKKDKGNAKAYFRRGKALTCLNDYEGALSEQKKALSLAPNDKSILEEISRILKMKKNYLAQEKIVFGKMFSNSRLMIITVEGNGEQ